MGISRALLLLAIFFVGLYILRDPVQKTGPNLNVLVVQPFKSFFNNLKTATTSLSDYSPLPGQMSPVAVVPKVVPYVKATTTFGSATKTAEQIITATTKKESAALPPVKSNVIDTDTSLTATGIIAFTNTERYKAGLKALNPNTKLSASAQLKLDDMFKNQYFEHVSPTGVSVADLADKAGYSFIVIGENLALGNFGGDEKVVAAWMASPGHKANILNKKYQEIGIAVGQRLYEGKKQWIAVQHFGTPIEACPSPNKDEKQAIDTMEDDLVAKEASLQEQKKSIDQTSGDAYKSNVEMYNKAVEAYNAMLTVLKQKIALYNESVKKFNSCVGL
ncbi:MAG: hypothetical protein RL094_671 [Candidatus Parcubacteria bacterium]|jgi:uncharacterized protein YkwD/uncharacterized protein YukE